jgi:KaiC/GvpD/RAD55 family RecA-like ATPase
MIERADIAAYLGQKGWKYKQSSKNADWWHMISCCPFTKQNGEEICGEPGKWGINKSTGAFKTICCGRIGVFFDLRYHMGDVRLEVRSAAEFRAELEQRRKAEAQLSGHRPKPALADKLHEDLMGAEPGVLRANVIEYLLTVCKLSMATLKRFKVGMVVSALNTVFSPDARLTVPHYWMGLLTDIRYHEHPPDKERIVGAPLSEPMCSRVPFNCDCLDGLRKVPADQRCVFVCGDEWSAMALLQLGYEFVLGADDHLVSPDRARWPTYWTDPFIEAIRIYLCHDATEYGQKDAERVAKILGQHRCVRIVPPAPAESWLGALASGADCPEVEAAIARGETMAPKEVTRPGDYMADLETKLFSPHAKGASTLWPDLDRVLDSIRPHEITAVTGGSGDGKSTWSTALAYNLASQGVPVLSIPLELDPVDTNEMLVSIQAGKSSKRLSVPELYHAGEKVSTLPIYMLDVRDDRGNRRTSMSVDEMIGYVRYAMETHGVRFVVLDHLLRFFGGMSQRQQWAAIRPTMEKLSGFVKDNPVHLLIVCHPKTPANDRKRGKVVYTLDDVWGGNATLQEAWNGISINRMEVEGKPVTRIRVEKCRSQAGQLGYVDFRFEREGLRYVSGGEAMTNERAFETIMNEVRARDEEDAESPGRQVRYGDDKLPADEGPTEGEWLAFNETTVH